VGKAQHKDVKAFAAQMVTDHRSINKQMEALAKKLKVKNEDSDTSQVIKAGAEENRTKLGALKGDEFDRAYIDHEIVYHQQVLDTLDNTLIPGAQNADLKALLEKIRPAFVDHLERAQKVQATLDQGTGGGEEQPH
jgi:putative membrane protein